MHIAIGRGELRGREVVQWLTADYAMLTADAVVHLDSARAWGGAIWRIGPEAYRLHLAGTERLTAAEALRAGLADRLVPPNGDPIEWMDGRSEVALESAALLIRSRGGEALERAEFARLFAAGEPQIGLTAFLERRRPEWRQTR
jgi:enoyl-CoA hydratase/carnithine racemase